MAVPFFIWEMVFVDRAQVAGFEWSQMKTYVLVSALFTVLMDSNGGLGSRISRGDVICDLTRPWRLSVLRLSESIGQCSLDLLAGIALFISLSSLMGDLALPSSLTGWLLFLVSVLLAVVVKACISTTWVLGTLWTYNSYGVERIRRAVTAVLSGAVVPLSMFPAWLHSIASYLPFQGIVTIPAQIAIGRGGYSEALIGIAIQVGWIFGLIFLAELLWYYGLRRMTLQGG
ncbi:ABC transporter permease [Nonomuraea sp. NPDC049714]|uniref:ABC transporter permease n=1 Tax=Nonomuraea sp. NPDC049714 TaxID=3364357 RepID=UPI0037AA0F9B